jgi:hypothetical protein
MYSQLQLGAGFSGIFYNLRQDRGDNIFDSKGPYFIPGLHFRAGWELNPHFVLGANVHMLLPKQEITQTYVYTGPPKPPMGFEVQDLFTTSARAADLGVKWYLAGGTEATTRIYLSGGLGLTRFKRTHQLTPYDTTLYSSQIPETEFQNIFPVHISFGLEADMEVAYLMGEARFSGGLTGNNAQYVGINAGVGFPISFGGKKEQSTL